MKPALLTTFILFAVMRVSSQFVDIDPLKRVELDSLNAIEALFDSAYNVLVIPNDALQGDYDVLIMGLTKYDVEKTNTNTIEISWPSNYIDGSYILVITPRQIFLRSSHDNPNPNYLYWVSNISERQFSLIKNYLETKEINFYSIAEIEDYRVNYWIDKSYDNFLTLLNIINKPLVDQSDKILIPGKNDFDKIKKLRLISGPRELQDSINH